MTPTELISQCEKLTISCQNNFLLITTTAYITLLKKFNAFKNFNLETNIHMIKIFIIYKMNIKIGIYLRFFENSDIISHSIF